MSKLAIFILVLFCSTIAGFSGAVSGYYAALSIPSVSSIAVLDIEDLASRIDPSSPDAKRAADLLTAKARDITEKLNAAGIVVLDRSAVLSAPADSMVRVELTPSPEAVSQVTGK